MIILSDESKEQLKFWQQNIRHLNCKRMFCANRCSKIIYSDARSSGYAGFQVSTINKVVHGMWSPDETVKSSTWRELSVVYGVLRSLVGTIKNSKVKWYSDNAAVCSMVSKESMKLHLQQIAYDIFSVCVRYSIKLDFEWIPRTLNDKAGYFSKILDSDDWGLSSKLFDIISSRWGPFAVDWFASEHNAKVATFYTRFWCERTAGVDAFMEHWGGNNGYYVPPISQISKVIKHMERCNAFGVMVIPYWESAPFWPLLCVSKGCFKKFVLDCIDLPTEKGFTLNVSQEMAFLGIRT